MTQNLPSEQISTHNKTNSVNMNLEQLDHVLEAITNDHVHQMVYHHGRSQSMADINKCQIPHTKGDGKLLAPSLDCFEIGPKFTCAFLFEMSQQINDNIRTLSVRYLDFFSPFWQSAWPDDIDVHTQQELLLNQMSDFAHDLLTEKCKACNLQSKAEFCRTVDLQAFLQSKVIDPIRLHTDTFLLRKFVKWRKKLEEFEIQKYREFDEQNIKKMKKQLNLKYFKLLISNEGAGTRCIEELAISNKSLGFKAAQATRDLAELKLFGVQQLYLQFFHQRFQQLRTELLLRFHRYEKKRIQRLFAQNTLS